MVWGDNSYGGDSSEVQENLVDVVDIVATCGAFAALKKDGTIVTWGDSSSGGNSSSVSGLLTDVINIIPNTFNNTNNYPAVTALKEDNTVVSWGYESYGGYNSSTIFYTGSSTRTGIIKVYSSNQFFVGLRSDGSYIAWGSYNNSL